MVPRGMPGMMLGVWRRSAGNGVCVSCDRQFYWDFLRRRGWL